jgi:SAM-dependent methyltransferase
MKEEKFKLSDLNSFNARNVIKSNRIESALNSALSSILFKHKSRIGQNDLLFLGRMYGGGISKYIDRLRAIGFTNRNRILDAGCGFGQWTLSLAATNSHVIACDTSGPRLEVLADISNTLKVDNITISQCGLESISCPDDFFDCIFCYSVIYVMDFKKVINEFMRVLRPGGRLYICTNGLGWYLSNIEKPHNPAADFDPKQIAVNAIANTIGLFHGLKEIPGAHQIVPSVVLCDYLRSLDFNIVSVGAEGSVTVSTQAESPPRASFFAGSYCGVEAVYEVLCELP